MRKKESNTGFPRYMLACGYGHPLSAVRCPLPLLLVFEGFSGVSYKRVRYG
jgi:hypothetical protein